eukprot:m.55122 g.55122  ORF g.55122 m.55122 type:complete len:231 (+) comp11467_c0_seq2:236-928(+)
MRQRHECHGVHWIMWTCQRLVLIVTLAITLQPLSSVGKAPAVFFYSPHKTGSVLVYDILTIASSVMKLCHLRVQHNSRQGACGTYVRCFGRTMGESFSFHRQKDAAEFCPAWIEEQLTGLSRADYTQEPYLYYPVARRGFLYGPIRHSEPYTDIVSSLSKNPRVRPVVICHKRHPLVSFQLGFLLDSTACQPCSFRDMPMFLGSLTIFHSTLVHRVIRVHHGDHMTTVSE